MNRKSVIAMIGGTIGDRHETRRYGCGVPISGGELRMGWAPMPSCGARVCRSRAFGAGQERYLKEGVPGLLRDKPRPSRIAPLSAEKKLAIIEKAATERPANATHWSARKMAKAVGVSHRSVQRVWTGAGLKRHLTRTFKLSNDPKFAEKVVDVAGLYMNPPEHALVLCVDEKTQIQALDRTQPGLPIKKGQAQTMTHDYKRNGTTTLFAALDVKTGQVIGECRARHRAKEFISFLKK